MSDTEETAGAKVAENSPAKGKRYGGRAKGTPNKRTQQLSEILESMGCDPALALARVVMDQNMGSGETYKQERFTKEGQPYTVLGYDTEIKVRAATELCQYLYPKRKAVEHSGAIDTVSADERRSRLLDLLAPVTGEEG